MKKILALTIACSVLSGCSYLGEPEAYTVVEEETAPIATPIEMPMLMNIGRYIILFCSSLLFFLSLLIFLIPHKVISMLIAS
ncbi:MAG: hypothetical protein IKZ02_04865, partial [Alphaproteobacteria bacterium]|nr:hypothetical protein [Alphaproteobacteria bacterium]